MNLLSDAERAALQPAEFASFDGPIPTQIVSSDEYAPIPQTAKQGEVEARLKRLADELSARQNMTRRAFLRTASGMAAMLGGKVRGDPRDTGRYWLRSGWQPQHGCRARAA